MPKANTKIRLNLNIGAKDKQRLGLKDVPALEGDVVDVDADAAEVLKANGWGIEASAKAAKDEPAAVETPNVPVDTTESRDTAGPAAKAAAAVTSKDDKQKGNRA